MDLNWIAPTLVALGSLIAAVMAALQVRDARKEAKENAAVAAAADLAAVEQQAVTLKRVDGRMEEMLKLVEESAAAKATLAEKAAERDRKAAALSESVRVLPADPSAEAQRALEAAAEAAKKLLEDAAITAAKLLADSRKRK